MSSTSSLQSKNESRSGWPYRKVFLTGATGLIGGQILRDLLEFSQIEEISCLVRPAGQQSCLERVKLRLEKAGLQGKKLEKSLSRVRTVEGEITQPLWDINSEELTRLRKQTDLFIHCAASTSFVDVASCEAMNVNGVRNMLEVVDGCENLKKLVHFSTATLCGYKPDSVVKEEESPSDKHKHVVAYTRSKAQAEKILWANKSKLPLLVLRPSITMARGTNDPKQARLFLWSLWAIDQLPFVPVRADSHIDIVSLDFVVNSTMLLIAKGDDLAHDCYNLSAGEKYSATAGQINDAILPVAKDGGTEFIPPEQWTDSHEQVIEEQGLGTLYQSLLYLPFINMNMIYDNTRLIEELGEDFPHLPKFNEYVAEMMHVIKPDKIILEGLDGFGS